MSETEEFDRWIAALGRGDPEAERQACRRYFAALVRVARSALHGLSGRVADEEDVALAALYSFFRGVEQGRFHHLDDPQHLWRLLATITVRAAGAERRRRHAARRGPLDPRAAPFAPAEDHGLELAVDDEPSPELVAMTLEDCRGLFDTLGDPTLRRIALDALEGYRTGEIATRLGCSARTVERKIRRIRRLWEEFSRRDR